jgi:hypothetical protein
MSDIMHQIEQHDAEERARQLGWSSVVNFVGGTAVLCGSAAFVFSVLRFFHL